MKTQRTKLSIDPIQTRTFRVGENLLEFILEQVDPSWVHESMVLAVTSKIVSLAEKRLVQKSSISKEALVDQEADYNLGLVAYGCYLTIKHGLFIPTAGIDESNSQTDDYILYPVDPFKSAEALWRVLRARWGIQKLGVLLTDSHTTPLRQGVTGISLAHFGFKGLTDLRGTPDLFGRSMKMTTVNVADGLATAATLMMGEANESRPLAIVDCADLVFGETGSLAEVSIPPEEDLYFPFFKNHLKK